MKGERFDLGYNPQGNIDIELKQLLTYLHTLEYFVQVQAQKEPDDEVALTSLRGIVRKNVWYVAVQPPKEIGDAGDTPVIDRLALDESGRLYCLENRASKIWGIVIETKPYNRKKHGDLSEWYFDFDIARR